MKHKRGVKGEVTFQLFSFLDVLLCTIGALIIILTIVIHRARVQASEAHARQMAPSPEQAKKHQEALEDARWRQEILEKQRAQRQEELQSRRLELSHLEDHIRRLTERGNELAALLDETEAGKQGKSEDLAASRQELEKLKTEIAKKQDELEKKKKKVQENDGWYALIPYDGPNGTRRMPIYVECVEEGVIVQPEGVILNADDFRGELDAGNPLDAALRAKREYIMKVTGGKTGEPYPLLVVRPSGVLAYSAARAAMKSWDDEFGYELISEEKKLDFGPRDPQLDQLMQREIVQARKRQAVKALAMPRKYQREEIVRSFGPESSSAPRPVRNGSGGGAGPGSPASGGKGIGPSGVAGSGLGGGGNGTGVNGEVSGAPGGIAGAGGTGSGGPRPANPGGLPSGQEPLGTGPYGTTGVPGGTSAGAGGNRIGTGPGSGGTGPGGAGSGGARPGGQFTAGANQGANLAGSANPGESSSAPGNSLRPGQKGTGPYAGGVPGGTAASGDITGSGDLAGGPAGGSSSPGTGGSPGGSSANGGSSGGATGGASGGSAGGFGASGSPPPGGQAAPGIPSISFSPGSSTPPAGEPSGTKARQRPPSGRTSGPPKGKNWGLPEAQRYVTGVTRPIRVTMQRDKLILLPETGDQRKPQEIPLSPEMSPQEVESLVTGVQRQMRSWGIAVDGGYWKPALSVDVQPGAEDRFAELKSNLSGSGIEIQRKIR